MLSCGSEPPTGERTFPASWELNAGLVLDQTPLGVELEM